MEKEETQIRQNSLREDSSAQSFFFLLFLEEELYNPEQRFPCLFSVGGQEQMALEACNRSNIL